MFFSYSFRRKPVACVGYSLGVTGESRAVEHLNQVMLKMEAIPLRTPTLIPFVTSAFDAEDKATSPGVNVVLNVMLDDLDWLGTVLKTARAEDKSLPAALRIWSATPRP